MSDEILDDVVISGQIEMIDSVKSYFGNKCTISITLVVDQDSLDNLNKLFKFFSGKPSIIKLIGIFCKHEY